MHSDYLTFRLDLTSSLLVDRANLIYSDQWDLDVRALRVLRLVCAEPDITPKAVSQQALIEKIEAQPGLHVAVDLQAQTVSTPDGDTHAFSIDAWQKRCLLEGLDELGYTLTQMHRIEAFERSYAD